MATISWTTADLHGTARFLPLWWDLLLERVEPALRTAPAPDGGPGLEQLRTLAEAEVDAAGAAPDGLEPAVEAALAALSAAGRLVVALGAGAATDTGSVDGIFVSDGGVPKLPIPEAVVGRRGIVGDRQAARQHHGRVWQALCLWSTDVVAALRAEGHPIRPGNAGENLALGGVDWASLRPGTRLQIGDVVVEISLPALPCAKNRQWFLGGDFQRMSHERDPAVTRWYATVLQPGRALVGDPVLVEP